MTPVRAPGWTRVVGAAIGIVALVLSGFCFFAPEALFGLDAYPLPARTAIGLLGSLAVGLGLTALVAAAEGEAAVLRAVVLALFVASVPVPAVVIYNIGAFNQADPTGGRAFGVAGGAILIISLPLLLSLLVLNRLRRAARAGSATEVRPMSGSARSAAR